MHSCPDQTIARHFSVNARDVTPSRLRSKACVLYLPVTRDEDMDALFRATLSGPERQRAERFASPDDAARFVQRRAFRRWCAATVLGSGRRLSKTRFQVLPTGQPYLAEAPELRFSFSSCRTGIVGAWSPECGVGVDIEDRAHGLDLVDMANAHFDKAEAEVVRTARGQHRMDAFLSLWSLKEAALKSIGQGLAFGMDAFTFELAPVPQAVKAPTGYGGPGRFSPFFLDGMHANAALVAHHHPRSV